LCCGVDEPDTEPGSKLDAPSWIPEWFVKLGPVRGVDGLPGSRGFINLSSSCPSVIPPIGRVLTLGGSLVDEVIAAGSVLPATLRLELLDTSWESFETIKCLLEEIRELYSNATQQNLSDIFLPFGRVAERIQSQELDEIDPRTSAANLDSLEQFGCDYGSLQQSFEALWKMPIMDNTHEYGYQFPIDLLRYGYLVLMGYINPPVNEEDQTQWYIQRSAEYRQLVKAVATNKLFFVSSQGYLGLGRPSVSAGDLIVLFDGASVPFIVRRGEKSKYRLVGEAYVYGIGDAGQSAATASIELY
jgi:hypothetical protein